MLKISSLVSGILELQGYYCRSHIPALFFYPPKLFQTVSIHKVKCPIYKRSKILMIIKYITLYFPTEPIYFNKKIAKNRTFII